MAIANLIFGALACALGEKSGISEMSFVLWGSSLQKIFESRMPGRIPCEFFSACKYNDSRVFQTLTPGNPRPGLKIELGTNVTTSAEGGSDSAACSNRAVGKR